MKKVLVILLIISTSIGVFYAVTSWRRNQILNSGRIVLLVDQDQGIYTYSDLLPRDEITRSYRIIGYADELTPDAIAKATAGLFLMIDAETTPGDPRIIPALTATAPVPEGESQKSAWSSALGSLPQKQRDLCGEIHDSAFQQYCLARHIVYNAIKAGLSSEACAPLYVVTQREECMIDVQAKAENRVADLDQNGLVDQFESLAQPAEERVNTLNLPELSY